jgi:hypothetical protein
MSVLLTGVALDSIPQVLAQVGRRHDPSRDFAVPFEAQRAATFYFKRETFQPYVGGVFTLRAGAKSVEATLLNVRDCTPNPKSKLTPKSRPSDSFALVFRAKGELTDLTTIYDVEHAALGSFPLFLTHREGPGGVHFYEAVFNHAL